LREVEGRIVGVEAPGRPVGRRGDGDDAISRSERDRAPVVTDGDIGQLDARARMAVDRDSPPARDGIRRWRRARFDCG